MQFLAMGLALWLAASVVFGLFWVVTAFAIREARRRWPHMAVDPAWRTSRHPTTAPRRSSGAQ